MDEYLVTGAASGIGFATVTRLAGPAHRVWALDRDADRLERVLDAAALPNVERLVADVGDEASVESALRRVAADADHLDGLVNCAGIIPVAPFDQHSVLDWERSYRVNVIGTYLVLRASLPLLGAGEAASVVNLASMAAKIPGPYTVAYNASKAAVVSLTRSSAAALAPRIRVNAVCPGVVASPMYEAVDAQSPCARCPRDAPVRGEGRVGAGRTPRLRGRDRHRDRVPARPGRRLRDRRGRERLGRLRDALTPSSRRRHRIEVRPAPQQ